MALIHEAGHLSVAIILKYKTAGIKIGLSGICLRIADGVNNYHHEILISAAGPLFNVIMIVLGITCKYIDINIHKAFFTANFYMLFINLLPVLPLDGGRIVRAVLSMEFGEKRARKIMDHISAPLICLLGIFGVIFLVKSKINASLLIISVFLCGNIRIKNKSTDIISMYSSDVLFDRTKMFYINENISIKDAIKSLPFEELYIVAVISDNGVINKFITNKYILNISENKDLNDKIYTI